MISLDKLWLANNHQELDFFYTTINEDATNNILLTFDVNNIANTGDKYMEEGNYEKAKAAYESLFSPTDLIKKHIEDSPSLIFWGILLKYQAANNLAAIAFNNNDRLQGLSELSYAIFYEIFLCLQDIAYTEDLDSFEQLHLPDLTSVNIVVDVIPSIRELNTHYVISHIVLYDSYLSILSNYLYLFAGKLSQSAFAQLFLITIKILACGIMRGDFFLEKRKNKCVEELINLDFSYFKSKKNRISAATMLQDICKMLNLPKDSKDSITAVSKIHQFLNEIK